ncbi:hypothetical protein LTR15_010073 [Elasticomyces elasticus]|nr:hypothetical protein LTR15_010073 [Elasticomyces elasticus]
MNSPITSLSPTLNEHLDTTGPAPTPEPPFIRLPTEPVGGNSEHRDAADPPQTLVIPLMRLPTELLDEITDFLTLQDLRTFHFTSRGAEYATQATYGSRAYAHFTLLLSRHACRNFVPDMIAWDQRALWIRKLHIVFQHGEPDELAIGSLLAKLPNLRELDLERLSSVSLQLQFDLVSIQAAEASLALESLSLSDCSLTVEELIACERYNSFDLTTGGIGILVAKETHLEAVSHGTECA